MKQLFLALSLLIVITMASCTSEEKNDPFLISSSRVGPLTRDIQVRQLDSAFAKDSIVRRNQQDGFSRSNEIMIYDKEGNELLLLKPVQMFDSTSTIGSIEIKDSRFKTDKDLNTESTFGDINTNYKISRIENTLRNALVFVDELNAYVTIDKENISGDARYNTDVKIEPTQIPDDAKIKHFWIGWK